MEFLERAWDYVGMTVTGAMRGFERTVTSVFGSSNARAMKKYQPQVDAISALESRYEAMSEEELREQTKKFRQRLAAGESLDDLLVEAFAVCREGGRRFLGMRHYDVQMLGGMVLHKGMIAEMVTGEGKTLVATLPAWQLTSFDPVLPAMDDRAFLKFVAALPSPPANPMADERFVRLVLRARETSPLGEADRRRFGDEIAGVLARRDEAARARRAAEAFRAWVRDRYAHAPHRALLVRLAGLEAWAKAGWDVRRIRTGLDEAVEAAAPLATFDDEARRDFIRRAASLAGTGPMRVDRVRIADDGRVDVTLGDSLIYDMDAARWARRLGIAP